MTFDEWWKKNTSDYSLHSDYARMYAEDAWNAALENRWMKIETAPKDGTWILAISKNAAGRWTNPLPMRWNYGWFFDGNYIIYHPPTHWMPVPTPPTSDSPPDSP